MSCIWFGLLSSLWPSKGALIQNSTRDADDCRYSRAYTCRLHPTCHCSKTYIKSRPTSSSATIGSIVYRLSSIVFSHIQSSKSPRACKHQNHHHRHRNPTVHHASCIMYGASFLPSVLSSGFLTQLELFLVCYRTSKAVKCSGSSTQVTPIGFFAYVPINSTFIYPIPRL